MRNDLRLITEVISRPYLYHKNLTHTNNKEQREKDWISVGEKLNLSSKVCKTRWRSLRDRFVKSWKHVNSADELGNLKSLLFLKDHLGKPRNQNLFPDSSNHISMDENDDVLYYYLPLAETEHKVFSDPMPHDHSQDLEFQEYMKSINNQNNEEHEDTDKIKHNLFPSRHVHFLNVLVEKLDQLSDEECDNVKMDVLNQLHKAVKERKSRLECKNRN